MYTLGAYGLMIADPVRVDAYAKALRKTIKPGSVVTEIGTGPGVFAVLACQLGARRVYAIEPGDIIQVARDIAVANGVADRIEFIQDISTEVTLPEPADVIVSDLRGVLPFFSRHIPSIMDARRRFLAPGGVLIPQRNTVWAGVAEAPLPYQKIVNAWERNSLRQDLSPARALAVNNLHKAHLPLEQLLTKAQLWATLDYSTVEDADARGELTWKVERAGIGHGVIVWFDVELIDGLGYSCGLQSPEGIYGSALFPWTQPVALVAGQTVRVRLEAKLMETEYAWRWVTTIEAAEPGGASIHYDQSQLNGAVLSLAKLRKGASNHVPDLSEQGRLHRRTLQLMDGNTSLEEISQRLVAEFPLFSRWQQALTYAGALSQEYGR